MLASRAELLHAQHSHKTAGHVAVTCWLQGRAGAETPINKKKQAHL